MENNKTILIASFPGTGKSYFYKNTNFNKSKKFVDDSDSSKFDKAEFPQNYIEYIKEKISENYSIIFILNHKKVRDLLVENGLDFTLIYPKKELKQEYLERCKKRGSSYEFINLLSNNWDLWLVELQNQKNCKHIQLESGQFISDVCKLIN